MIVDPNALRHEQGHAGSTGEALGQVALLLDGVLRLHHEVLAPGHRSARPHQHSTRDEAIVVLSGRPTLVTTEGRDTVEPGQICLLPAGSPTHTLINDGPEDAVFVVASADRGHDVVTYEAGP